MRAAASLYKKNEQIVDIGTNRVYVYIYGFIVCLVTIIFPSSDETFFSGFTVFPPIAFSRAPPSTTFSFSPSSIYNPYLFFGSACRRPLVCQLSTSDTPAPVALCTFFLSPLYIAAVVQGK